MKILKCATQQKISLYSDNLFDATPLEGCDITLVKKTLALIKKLVEVDTEKARIIDAALKDYVNSPKKAAFHEIMCKGMFLFFNLFAAVLGLGVGIPLIGISILFFFPILAGMLGGPMMLLIIAGMATGFVALGIAALLLTTNKKLLNKIIDSTKKTMRETMEKIADKLNTYCDEDERELEAKKDSRLVSKESDSIEGFKTQYATPRFFSLSPRGDAANNVEDRQATQHLNNMILATQKRK